MSNKNRYIAVIVILVSLPIYLLVFITREEMKKYDTGGTFIVNEKAYGNAQRVLVGTIEESYIVNGEYSSETIVYNDILSTCGISVEINEEVFKNQRLGVCNNAGLSQVNGIVKRINYIEDFIRIEIINIDEIVFIGYVSDLNVDLVIGDYETLDGKVYTLYKKSNVMNTNGRQMFFKLVNPDKFFGDNESIELKTGVSEENVLMILEDAVYKNYDGNEVVRVIDDEGNVIEERNIETGIRGNGYVAVSGLNEGELYDIEYGKYQNRQRND